MACTRYSRSIPCAHVNCGTLRNGDIVQVFARSCSILSDESRFQKGVVPSGRAIRRSRAVGDTISPGINELEEIPDLEIRAVIRVFDTPAECLETCILQKRIDREHRAGAAVHRAHDKHQYYVFHTLHYDFPFIVCTGQLFGGRVYGFRKFQLNDGVVQKLLCRMK